MQNENEIPVTCPVCSGHALLNRSDRAVQCFATAPVGKVSGHKLMFLPSHKFDTLAALGHLPPDRP